MQTNHLHICALSISNIFFLFQKNVLIQWNTIYEALYSQPKWTQHICKTIYMYMVNRPRTRNSFSKVVDMIQLIYWQQKHYLLCPSSKQYTPEISGRPWLDHVTGRPYTITKRGKGGAYVDIIRLWSTTCEPPVTLIRYFLLLYSLLLQYAE